MSDRAANSTGKGKSSIETSGAGNSLGVGSSYSSHLVEVGDQENEQSNATNE